MKILTLAIYILMPVVALVAGVKIYMFRQDHNPPHFHAKYSGKEEVFYLEVETMKGSIGEKKRKKIRKWAKATKTPSNFIPLAIPSLAPPKPAPYFSRHWPFPSPPNHK